MFFYRFKNTVLLLLIFTVSCRNSSKVIQNGAVITKNKHNDTVISSKNDLIIAANKTGHYLPLLEAKNVGVVANQTSVIFKNDDKKFTHLVDSLKSLNISVKKVFTPEHGFRGQADAGEAIKDGVDLKTGLPIISLYGTNKKPNKSQLHGIEIVVFDIQDVGARFYTYISTLHYVMEACAESKIPLLILDRPNPNGHYVDGPILEKKHQSFVGMHPVPVVHGLTIGEYAQMINGEGWLNNGIKCDLKIIKMENYSRFKPYNLPINPSPNLPNATAINLYPSLCFFEGTNISVGRGTNKQFQVIGTPFFKLRTYNFTFTPQPNLGAKNPLHQGKACYGYNLENNKRLNEINLAWLIEFYKQHQYNRVEEAFFNSFFTKLAGTEKLQKQIELGMSINDIKASWQEDLEAYKKIRNNYILYN